MAFRVLIIGGTGQVGAAVVRALVAEPSCREVVMVNRRASASALGPRIRQVVFDTASPQFQANVTALAKSLVAQGDPVFGASCVGVGKGSAGWTDEELKALEIGVVGGFARGCHAGGIAQFALLSAVGSNARSRVRYVRVMGLKEEAVQAIGFKRLALFRPGIIGGNAHTPGYAAWLGRRIPGRFGTIEQDDIGRAFAAEFVSSSNSDGVVSLENGAMRQKSREFLKKEPGPIDSGVRGIAWASLIVQIGIVGTGGAVRLTGSGLGCPTWPRCTPDTFVVMPEQGIHGAIEFGNRMLTFVLAAVAVLALLAVWNWRRSRPDLWRATVILAAGIPAQAALGGLTVLTGLNPWLVGAHFLLSAALVSVAAVFVARTQDTAGRPDRVPALLVSLGYAVVLATAVALVLGVVTTGAGPHAGDAATPRNGLNVELLQHLHSYPAYVMLLLTAALVGLVQQTGATRLRPLALGLLALEFSQIALGIAQAHLGVPALLVGLHMLLACMVVATLTMLITRLRGA